MISRRGRHADTVWDLVQGGASQDIAGVLYGTHLCSSSRTARAHFEVEVTPLEMLAGLTTTPRDAFPNGNAEVDIPLVPLGNG